MIFNNFQVIPFSIPFIKPFKSAQRTYTHREGIWLSFQWKNFIGVGEASPLQGFSQESIKEVHYALEGFHQSIKGENYDKEGLISLIQIFSKNIPSSQFALETALFDLLSQTKNFCLAKYLNPKHI